MHSRENTSVRNCGHIKFVQDYSLNRNAFISVKLERSMLYLMYYSSLEQNKYFFLKVNL